LPPIRTISEIDLEFTLFVSEPFRYQEICEEAMRLYRLGMNCFQISKALSEEPKTIKRALRWGGEL